mgnify:CR=1 FL=1
MIQRTLRLAGIALDEKKFDDALKALDDPGSDIGPAAAGDTGEAACGGAGRCGAAGDSGLATVGG